MKTPWVWTKEKPELKGYYLVYNPKSEHQHIELVIISDKRDALWVKTVPRYKDVFFCGPIVFPKG